MVDDLEALREDLKDSLDTCKRLEADVEMGDWLEVNVKPLSVNKAYRGRRFKTRDYVKYIRELKEVLPHLNVPAEGFLKLYVEVYYSNRGNDIDNALKPFIDVLQKFYYFNDNRIYKLEVEKFIVLKGNEKIRFKLEVIDDEE